MQYVQKQSDQVCVCWINLESRANYFLIINILLVCIYMLLLNSYNIIYCRRSYGGSQRWIQEFYDVTLCFQRAYVTGCLAGWFGRLHHNLPGKVVEKYTALVMIPFVHKQLHSYKYIYICIYMCVCMCVGGCVCVSLCACVRVFIIHIWYSANLTFVSRRAPNKNGATHPFRVEPMIWTPLSWHIAGEDL